MLASYLRGVLGPPEEIAGIWGGVPESLRPTYSISMLVAAAGYFPFTSYILLALDPAEVRIGSRFGYRVFHALYAPILFLSAAWLPLTAQMLAAPSAPLWWAIRTLLLGVGVASLALFPALWSAAPRGPRAWLALSLLGLAGFSFQTAVLDALLWTAWYPFPA